MRVPNQYKANLKAGYCFVGFFLCLILFSGNDIKGQYMVTGEVIDVEKAYHNVIVELATDESNKRIRVSDDGRFLTSLQWNERYYFSFKKEGYVTKIIEFSTILPQEVNRATIHPYHMPVRLFKIFKGVDTVFFNNPVAKIRYDKAESDFSVDKDYSLMVKYKVNEMRQMAIRQSQKNQNKSVSASSRKKAPVDKSVKPKKKAVQVIPQVNNKEQKVKHDMEITGEPTKGIPPLKASYPEGESVEEYKLHGRITRRTIFYFQGQRRVFLAVKHDWGGQFYFIDQAAIGYRCISKDVYHLSIQKYRSLLSHNK